MMPELISEEEKKECIEYMLQNDEIELALNNWEQHKNSDEYMCKVLDVIAARSEECGGFIVAILSDNIPTGVNYIALFTGEEKGEIHRVENSDGKSYAMVFTSKSRFQKCNDTSGLVMFIDEVFDLLESKAELDGMVINFGSDDIIFDKIMMRAAICIMRQEKEKKLG